MRRTRRPTYVPSGIKHGSGTAYAQCTPNTRQTMEGWTVINLVYASPDGRGGLHGPPRLTVSAGDADVVDVAAEGAVATRLVVAEVDAYRRFARCHGADLGGDLVPLVEGEVAALTGRV